MIDIPSRIEAPLIKAMERIKARTGARTWHIEHAVAGSAFLATLLIRTAAFGNGAVELIGTTAAFLTFSYVSLAERIEHEARRPERDRGAIPDLTRRLYLKESVWLAYFLLTGATSAAFGAILFLSYGMWRKAWRRRSSTPSASPINSN